MFIEKFDSTPGVADRESLIVKFGGGANLAGIGFDGQLLITEYGPIAASLSLSAGSIGVPLGPVTLFEAGALILFNEQVPELPDNPLRLLDPPESDEGSFDLTAIIDRTRLDETMLANARDFIADNEQARRWDKIQSRRGNHLSCSQSMPHLERVASIAKHSTPRSRSVPTWI